MLLKEKGKLVLDEKQLTWIMNKFFINITKNLNLKEDLNLNLKGSPPVTLNDILKIEMTFSTRVLISIKKFSFQQVTEEHVRQVILSNDGSKVTHLSLITKIINLSFENGCFPDDLKLAEVSPIFKI